MPWATEQNRKRLRAYGGVFKGAAVRFGIYSIAAGEKLYVEARGNNIQRVQAVAGGVDEDELELRLVDTKEAVSDEEYEQRILQLSGRAWEVETDKLNGGEGNVEGKKGPLVAARGRLLASGSLEKRLGGTSGRKALWKLSTDAGSSGSQNLGNQISLGNDSQLVPGSDWFPLRGGTGGTSRDASETPRRRDPILMNLSRENHRAPGQLR